MRPSVDQQNLNFKVAPGYHQGYSLIAILASKSQKELLELAVKEYVRTHRNELLRSLEAILRTFGLADDAPNADGPSPLNPPRID